jgi:hypothetical protein
VRTNVTDTSRRCAVAEVSFELPERLNEPSSARTTYQYVSPSVTAPSVYVVPVCRAIRAYGPPDASPRQTS